MTKINQVNKVVQNQSLIFLKARKSLANITINSLLYAIQGNYNTIQ